MFRRSTAPSVLISNPRAGADLPRRIKPTARAHTGRRIGKSLAILFTALTGILVFNVVSESGRDARATTRGFLDADTIASLAGFGIDQVSLTGHRFTADTDVFDALDLGNVRSIASFDGAAVRNRLERLPWIATAELTRVFPDGLDVRITERKPFAVWTRGERHYVIDHTGRVLSAVSSPVALDLPRVSGEGAAAEAEALLVLIGRYPDMARRLEEAERVAERRWTLKLSGGVRLNLPADREAAVLEEIAHGGELARLVGGENCIIDLRAPGRVTVRAAGEGVRSAAGEKPRG
jgi:cell division protein FtsQ